MFITDPKLKFRDTSKTKRYKMIAATIRLLASLAFQNSEGIQLEMISCPTISQQQTSYTPSVQKDANTINPFEKLGWRIYNSGDDCFEHARHNFTFDVAFQSIFFNVDPEPGCISTRGIITMKLFPRF